jgi:hypothetical protein
MQYMTQISCIDPTGWFGKPVPDSSFRYRESGNGMQLYKDCNGGKPHVAGNQ